MDNATNHKIKFGIQKKSTHKIEIKDIPILRMTGSRGQKFHSSTRNYV